MEDSSFQRKSVISVVPVLLPLQPSQSFPSPETCQLISYRSKGFADNHCHAPLYCSQMHGSNTGNKLVHQGWSPPGKEVLFAKKGMGLVHRRCAQSVLRMPFLSSHSSPALQIHSEKPILHPGVLLTTFAPAFFHSHGYLPAAEGGGHLQEICAEMVLRPQDQELCPLLVRRLWRQREQVQHAERM